jgi:hypothetical protein
MTGPGSGGQRKGFPLSRQFERLKQPENITDIKEAKEKTKKDLKQKGGIK